MKGHVLMDAEIIDTEAYAEFAKKSQEAVAAHGGRVLVRTRDIEAIQGDWMPKRLVVLEFDNLEAARGYTSSAEYTRPSTTSAAVRRRPISSSWRNSIPRRESGLARYADGTMRAGLSRARRRRVAQAKFA